MMPPITFDHVKPSSNKKYAKMVLPIGSPSKLTAIKLALNHLRAQL